MLGCRGPHDVALGTLDHVADPHEAIAGTHAIVARTPELISGTLRPSVVDHLTPAAVAR